MESYLFVVTSMLIESEISMVTSYQCAAGNAKGNMKMTERLRKRERLTQCEFAERIGTTQNLIAAWENGRTAPSLRYILKICEEFHVTPNWLLGFDFDNDLIEAQNQLDEIIDELDELCETIEHLQKRLKDATDER